MEKDDIRISRLKEAMRNRDMTARELAIKANISEASISRYLSGKLSPKLDSIQLLAKALNVDPVWLLGYDPVVPESSDITIKKNSWLSTIEQELTADNLEKLKSFADYLKATQERGTET